jgi:DNA repair exonuclease SbcCD nuclease subunit
MKFLHTADWHLGRPFSRFNREQNRSLYEARFTTLRAIFDYARDNTISYILAAGDQFDSGECKTLEPIHELLGLIRAYPDITFIMITGNHDPLLPYNIYSKVDRSHYPENLILINEPRKVELDSDNTTIYAASLYEKKSREQPFLSLPAADQHDGSRIRVGLAHGSLAIPGKYEEDDFPIPATTVKDFDLDYLALGHWHSYYGADEKSYYPGTHEPMSFDNDCSVLEVEIESRGKTPRVSRIPVGSSFHWEKETLTVSDATFERLHSELDQPSPTGIKHLHLEGFLSPSAYEEVERIIELAGASWFSLTIENDLKIKPSPKELEGLPSLGYLNRVIDAIYEEENLQTYKDREIPVETEEIKNEALLKIYRFLRQRDLL